jgi:putative flippase GtrA
MPQAMKNILKQFIKFCGVGVINTAVGLAVILFLSETLHVHYITANIVGYAVGLTISFVLNRRFTFAAENKKPHTQALSFLIVFGVSYLCQLAVLVLLVRGFAVPNAPAQIIACAVYTLFNFAGNRWFTFRK